MSNRLDLPPELASLIEKREQEDRRKQECPPAGEAADKSAANEQRRSVTDRRANDS